MFYLHLQKKVAYNLSNFKTPELLSLSKNISSVPSGLYEQGNIFVDFYSKESLKDTQILV